MLDSGQGNFAITAPRALGGLVQTLRFEHTAGSTDRAITMRRGIVRVTNTLTCPTSIRHDDESASCCLVVAVAVDYAAKKETCGVKGRMSVEFHKKLSTV